MFKANYMLVGSCITTKFKNMFKSKFKIKTP